MDTRRADEVFDGLMAIDDVANVRGITALLAVS